MGVKNIRINQEKKENILSFEEHFDGFLEAHEGSNNIYHTSQYLFNISASV